MDTHVNLEQESLCRVRISRGAAADALELFTEVQRHTLPMMKQGESKGIERLTLRSQQRVHALAAAGGCCVGVGRRSVGVFWVGRHRRRCSGACERCVGDFRCAQVHQLAPQRPNLLLACVALRLEQTHPFLNIVTGQLQTLFCGCPAMPTQDARVTSNLAGVVLGGAADAPISSQMSMRP